MTTKKQRRDNVAAKTEKRRESERRENAEILRRSKDRAEQARFEKEREENKKKASAKIAQVHFAQRKAGIGVLLTDDEAMLLVDAYAPVNLTSLGADPNA